MRDMLCSLCAGARSSIWVAAEDFLFILERSFSGFAPKFSVMSRAKGATCVKFDAMPQSCIRLIEGSNLLRRKRRRLPVFG